MADTQKNALKQQAVPMRFDDGSLAARIIEAQDNERRKISRELHDGVGQSLVAAQMVIARFKRERSIADNTDLDQALRILDATLSEIRTLSHLLHPPNLELLGLRASLEWLVEGFEQRTGIRAHLEAPGNLPSFSPAAMTAIFRIAQEALTNVHRHSEASRVKLCVTIGLSELELEVADNGKGFADVEACRQGVGILGMQERLAELGGTLRVESGRGAGTSLFATVPLEGREQPPGVGPREFTSRETVANILVVDDHPAIRQGLRTMLDSSSDLKICGEASNVQDASRLVRELRPDIVLLDLQLGSENGWSVVRSMNAMKSPAKIIIFSHYAERYVAAAAKSCGCDGFVSKSQGPEKLVTTIRTVLRTPRSLRIERSTAATNVPPGPSGDVR